MRQAADGSQVIIFDVSFPQHLPQQMQELQYGLQQHNSWANASTAFADMSFQASQKAGFYPSQAAVADWQAPLAAICNSLCSIAASGSGRVMVKAPVQFSQVLACQDRTLRQSARLKQTMHILSKLSVANLPHVFSHSATWRHQTLHQSVSADHTICLAHQSQEPVLLPVMTSCWPMLTNGTGMMRQAVVEWLTAQPQVHWVSPRAQTKASNFFATGISQCGSAATLADASNAAGASGDAGTHPLWDAGNKGYWKLK